MDLVIKKNNWTPVKLGDVFTKKEENDKENASQRFDRFLKVEHLDKESLHIKRWCSQENGDEINPTFYKIFRKGQILFPTRNPHLRRTALASFDGITGEKTLTLEPNEEFLVPEFIPFLFHSESFYAHTTGAIIGSTNPHCRWRDVANYEFLLPPKAEQTRLAKLLWAMDEVIEREREVLTKLENAYQSKVDSLFSKKIKRWDFVRLDKIASVNHKSLNSKTEEDYEFKYLDLASIIEPRIIGELKSMQFNDAPSRARRVVEDNSIVLALVRPYQKAFAFVEDGTDIIASTGTAVVKLNDSDLDRFVFHQFFSNRFLRYCEDRMTGTNYPAITPKDVSEFKVSIPVDKGIVKIEAERLDHIEKAMFAIRPKISSSQTLQKSLINQVF